MCMYFLCKLFFCNDDNHQNEIPNYNSERLNSSSILDIFDSLYRSSSFSSSDSIDNRNLLQNLNYFEEDEEDEEYEEYEEGEEDKYLYTESKKNNFNFLKLFCFCI